MTKNWLDAEEMAARIQHFREDMLSKGIHVGVKDKGDTFVCACGQPWPCDGAKPPEKKLRERK